MESQIDELARAAGKDPVEYRRTLSKDHPRHLGVLNLAAQKSDWGSALPPGRARGVAVHESFGSFAAQVAEVSTQRRTARRREAAPMVTFAVFELLPRELRTVIVTI